MCVIEPSLRHRPWASLCWVKSCWVNLFRHWARHTCPELCVRWTWLHWWFSRTHSIRLSRIRWNSGITIVDQHKIPLPPTPHHCGWCHSLNVSFYVDLFRKYAYFSTMQKSTYIYQHTVFRYRFSIYFVSHYFMYTASGNNYSSRHAPVMKNLQQGVAWGLQMTTQGNVVSSLYWTL